MMVTSSALPFSANMPLSVLLETLRSWQEPITLSARLPPRPEWGTNQATAWVLVREGRVQSAVVLNAQGIPLLHDEATLSHLTQAGTLSWLVTPVSQEKTLACPCRVGHASLAFASKHSTLSRRHRQLLLLLDGSKTIPDLARLLHLAPHEVETLLHDLRQHHLIL